MTSHSSLGWLHLTDLHAGARRFCLWPGVEDDVLDDLAALHRLCGPWDFVFFTGDLVYSGKSEEYREFDQIRQRLLGRVRELNEGAEPIFLAVPGNHDVEWDDADPGFLYKADAWHSDRGLQERFWVTPDDDLRRGVEAVLGSWTGWFRGLPLDDRFHFGLLPGDFSASFDVSGLSVGVVGLNSTFLQLQPGNFKGRLALDVDQINAVCGSGPAWARGHHVTFLLTHHPPDWIGQDARDHFVEQIAPPGKRFDVHLYGHQHEARILSVSEAGSKPRLEVLGRSLFGLEFREDGEQTVEREHGYSAGRIRFDGDSRAFFRLWPRRLERKSDRTRAIDPDRSVNLPHDYGNATDEWEIIRRGRPGLPSVPSERIEETAGREGSTKPEVAIMVAPSPTESLDQSEQDYLAWLVRRTRDFPGLETLHSLVRRRRESESVSLREWIDRLFIPVRLSEPRQLEERATLSDPTGRAAPDARDGRAPPFPAVRPAAVPTAALGDASALAPHVGSRGRRRRHQSLGEILRGQRRVVVLGKAGTGKSTVVRWATAGLARRELGETEDRVPDFASLPAADLLPVYVECRGLTSADESIDRMLEAVAREALDPVRAPAAVDLIRERLRSGGALVLLDGLDEIHDVAAREQFCRRIEAFCDAYENASIVVTSRVAGYRELDEIAGGPLRAGFTEFEVDEWLPADREAFARRWAAVTERADAVRRRAIEGKLIEAIRDPGLTQLTSSPLLLATMASVLTNTGELPRRRVALYAKAIDALLARRTVVGDRVTVQEATPQLHYVAYVMCEREEDKLDREELLEILRDARDTLKDERSAIERHPTDVFLDLVSDTEVLVARGRRERSGEWVDVFEFYHPTFREFLGGRAVAQRDVPERGQLDLSDHIGRLVADRALSVGGASAPALRRGNPWVETIRVAVACSGQAADDAVRAVLGTNRGAVEPAALAHVRPRAVLAALCLTGEPDVSGDAVAEVLDRLATQITDRDGIGVRPPTSLDDAALELARSGRGRELCVRLVDEIGCRSPDDAVAVGGVCAAVAAEPAALLSAPEMKLWLDAQKERIRSGDVAERVTACLAVMYTAYQGRALGNEELIETLMGLLEAQPVLAASAAWALWWLTDPDAASWHLSPEQRDRLVTVYYTARADQVVRQRVLVVLGNSRDPRALEIARAALAGDTPLVLSAAVRTVGMLGSAADFELVQPLAEDGHPAVIRRSAAWALGMLGDQRAVKLLTALLRDPDVGVRRRSAYGLGGLLLTGLGPTPGDAGRSRTKVRTTLQEEAIDRLIGRIAGNSRDDSPVVRRAVAVALGQAKAERAFESLRDLLLNRDEHPEVRFSAADALASVGGNRAVAVLARLLDDNDMRPAAIEALISVRDPDAAEELLDRFAAGETDLDDATLYAILLLAVPEHRERLFRDVEELAKESDNPAARRAAAFLAGRLSTSVPT